MSSVGLTAASSVRSHRTCRPGDEAAIFPFREVIFPREDQGAKDDFNHRPENFVLRPIPIPEDSESSYILTSRSLVQEFAYNNLIIFSQSRFIACHFFKWKEFSTNGRKLYADNLQIGEMNM